MEYTEQQDEVMSRVEEFVDNFNCEIYPRWSTISTFKRGEYRIRAKSFLAKLIGLGLNTQDHVEDLNDIIEYAAPRLYVNVYFESRCYGGPEEGGWYYSAGDPEESRHCASEGESDDVFKELTAKYDAINQAEGELNSLTSNYGEYVVCQQTHFARPYPDDKPRYE